MNEEKYITIDRLLGAGNETEISIASPVYSQGVYFFANATIATDMESVKHMADSLLFL